MTYPYSDQEEKENKKWDFFLIIWFVFGGLVIMLMFYRAITPPYIPAGFTSISSSTITLEK